jgi:CubicO group peptidase (beta-lactamase class C family)
VPELEPLATASPYGVRSELLRLPLLRDAVFRPARVSVAATPPEAFARIASGALADDVAVVPSPVAHGASGAVTLVRSSGDEVVIDVAGDGGVVALLRGYQRLWRAELEDGRALATLPVDLVLLGAEVPPGRHRVRFFVSAWPEAIAGLVALVALLGGAGALATGRRAA